MTQRDILVTSALPYANGPIHLGHMVEHIQTDIWVRYQQLRGNHCVYVCGEDAHGTPIMISAEKQNMSPEELIAKISKEHRDDFNDFLINFDNYYTTHSPENKKLSFAIYEQLKQRGDIITKTIQQAFDPSKNMFLPDRYIKGECPRCGAKDQYGDNCEVCGATYTPAELKNPISVLSGTTPITKESVHYFFNLEKYTEQLKQWTANGKSLQETVLNKLSEWLNTGLEPWDISRDAPYFGFEIPDAPGKYFYVWLDAPVGYMASLENLCQRSETLTFDHYWGKDSKAELYHFVGKDIIYFHGLFWPAMLMGAGFRTPTGIFSHGFLTVDGQKMSKSRGTFIKARTYLEHLDPEYLRYYFASKLTNGIEDIDLSFEDFMQRVNADLVNKVINIASRCAGFINKHFANQLSKQMLEPALFAELVTAGDKIGNKYEGREFSSAMRDIMELADKVNQYIDNKKPWSVVKEQGATQEVQDICSMGINLFRVLMIYLKPVLPKLAQKVEIFLNEDSLTWDARMQPLLDHKINTFEPLLTRITPQQIEALKAAAVAEQK